VHGCGGVGLSAIMIASALGARVVGIDIQPESLALAESVGAAVTINASDKDDIAEAVKDVTGGGAHVSIDALGSPETCFNSIACLRTRGRHVQVGLMLADYSRPEIPMDRVIAKELALYGSHGMQAYKYPELLHMITSGSLNPAMLVQRTVSLEEGIRELETMGDYHIHGVTVIDTF
jgi:alcohol dehydrogenase